MLRSKQAVTAVAAALAASQDAHEGRDSAGPRPQIAFLTVTDGNSVEAGIVCQMC